MLSDKNAKTSAIPSKFGTLNSLNFAVFNSTKPTSKAIKISFKIKIPTAIHQQNPAPKGKNKVAKMDAKIPNFKAEAV